MSMTNRLARWGGMRVSRRLSRAIPLIGTAVALVTVAATIRRKGVVRGSLDSGLNALPFVGALKAGIEVIRGRDLFRDKAAPPTRVS
jgi:hypothetical protein